MRTFETMLRDLIRQRGIFAQARIKLELLEGEVEQYKEKFK